MVMWKQTAVCAVGSVLSLIIDPTLGHPMFVYQCYTSYVLVLSYYVQLLLLTKSPRLQSLRPHEPDVFQLLST